MPKTRQPPTRSQITFGVLGVALCALLGLAITTQVRQTESGDGLDTARPADLLVLLDSLQQREANLNKEIADLQQSLITMRASRTGNQAVINDAKARLSALSIMVGTVGATGPGVILTINDPGRDSVPRRCSTSSTSCGRREPRPSRSRPATSRYVSGSIRGSSAPPDSWSWTAPP